VLTSRRGKCKTDDAARAASSVLHLPRRDVNTT